MHNRGCSVKVRIIWHWRTSWMMQHVAHSKCTPNLAAGRLISFDISTLLHANVLLHVTCDEQTLWMWSSRALIQPPIYRSRLLSCRNVTELLRIDVVSAMVHLLLALLPGSLSQPGNEASLLWPQVVYLRSTIATLVLVDHKNLTYCSLGSWSPGVINLGIVWEVWPAQVHVHVHALINHIG